MSHFGKKSITFFILVLLGIQTLVYGEEKALPLPLSEEEILKQKSDFDDKFNQLASKKQCQQIIAFTEAEVKEKPSITVHAYKTLYELDLQCLNKSQKSKYEVLAASQDNKESADVAYNLALNSVDKNCRKSNSLFWLEKAAKNGVEYKITLANLYHPSSSYFHTASGDIEIWAEFDKCVVKNDSKARLLYADYFSFKNPTAKCDIKYSSENISKEDEYLESERATAFAHDAYQFALLLKGEQKECYMNIAEINGSLAAKLFNIKKNPDKFSYDYLDELIKISNLEGHQQSFDSDYLAIDEATKLLAAAKKKIAQQQEQETRRLKEAKVKQRRDYPYTAIISCGFRGQNVTVMACFDKTELKISYNNRSTIYGIYDFASGNVGSRDSKGAVNINLPKHFRLQAQNSNKTLILTVKILDSKGGIVFEDQVSQWGVVNVRN